MENRNLFTFKRVCELNSITKAADQLGYAQSTVTTQIKLLETELGVKLFERFGNTIRITDAGKKLLEFSNEIFRITDRFLDSIHEGKETSGSLRIAAVDSICMTVLPDILNRFIQKYPNVTIKIVPGVADELKHYLVSGQADIALVLDFNKSIADELDLLLEKTVEVGFYIAADSPLESTGISLEDLKKLKFILTEPNCQYRRRFEAFFEKVGIKPDILMESASTEAIIKLVANGLGITYLPGLVANKDQRIKRLHLKDQESDILFLQLLMHKNKWKSTIIHEFIRICEVHLE
ncbi:MAG TPA: LysR family transcriptional regulator [Firmicutes bacterium]|jgi:DNA-binding transcriptional LysR family regulator|nr:LysR family transcriptional regulator [Bacillota bacterium]